MKQRLADDVLEEILSRLQVKDLLRFKSVSKQWLSIISTPIFVQLHLNKSILNPRILVRYRHTCKTIDHTEDVTKEVPMPKETIGLVLSGSCDGLLCYLDYATCYNKKTNTIPLCLWNPALRALTTMNMNIPLMMESSRIDGILFSWFGRDSNSNDYKLVIGVRYKSVKGMQLSSRRLHVIKPFAEDDYYYYDDQPIPEFADKLLWWRYALAVVLHGVVHWCAFQGRDLSMVLFWYDLSRKTLGEIPIPWKGDDTMLSSIFVLDGCIGAIWSGDNNHEFWIMKDYGVKESWTKWMIIPSGLILRPEISPPYPRLALIGVADNGDLILESNTRGHVLIYNVGGKQCKALASDKAFWSSIMYFETLIFP